MRKRDLGILILSAFAIFFSLQNEGNFSFKESWFHLVDETYPIKHEAERLPPPIVTDLNGDGRNEVIIATHDSKLQVLEPRVKFSDDGFSEARVIGEVSLLPDKVRVSVGRRPVAMASGIIQRSFNEGFPKKQVVVVVTAGWSIMCFDHNLKKLWEHSAQDDFPHGAFHKEVSISISNFTLRHGDVGLVIVGGSMEAQHQLHLDPFEEELLAERQDERHRRAAETKEDAEDVSAGKAHHFSYYAFAGLSGVLRWQHKSEDFLRDPTLANKLIPQHEYRLDESAIHRQYEEAHCRDYRESILQVMPHRWQTRDDTRFELVHFIKHERKHHKKLPEAKGNSLRLKRPQDKYVPGKDPANKVADVIGKAAKLASSSKRRKKHPYMPVITNHTSFWWIPNVVVAHLKEGIEAVHLASGRTVCKLWLQEGGLHADINGDGVIDHVQAVGGSAGTHVIPGTSEVLKPCSAVASSGFPIRQHLFNGSICRTSAFSAFQHGEYMSRAFGRNLDSAVIEVAAPILLQRSSDHAQVIFLTSRGEITSYTTEGLQMWQLITGAIWSTRPSVLLVDKPVPTLEVLPLRRSGHGEVILAAGEAEAVVVSPSGHQLASIPLPSAPVHPMLVADFSGDGLNDLILVTGSGIYGFVQAQHPGVALFSFLVACLIIAMCVIFVMQHVGSAKGKPRKKSTDL